ncbi:MAG: hypothetical protein ACRDMZ_10940, partial [Solirubrobacteraceae bacterium]
AIGVLAIGASAVASGTAQRLVQSDAPHVGLNFRRDEIRSASHLSARDLMLGQGLAGRFASRDVHGATVITGWSHVLPIWVVLKVGLLGLAALIVALGLLLRRAARLIGDQGRGPALIGIQLIGGLILMSLTIGRFAQPEGAMLLGLGAVLLAQPLRREAACD